VTLDAKLSASVGREVQQARVKALARYQVEVVTTPTYGADGRAQTITVEKARRIGLSEVAAIKVLGWCLGWEYRPDGGLKGIDPMSGIVVSKDYAGARELLAKIAANVRDLAAAGNKDCQAAIPYIRETKIFFPTKGTTVRALAGQGSTIRSWTGFVVLDEFAFVRNQNEVWGAARPVTDANWANPRGYPMLVISTPWESGSLAHRVLTELPFVHYSYDIHRAKRDGFPIDVEAKFEELGIRELIETEYLCMWSRGGESFFNIEKLRECLRDDGREKQNGDGTAETADECGLPHDWPRAPVFYGVDVGGGTGRDFTACVQYRLIGDEYWVTGVRAHNRMPIFDMIDMIASWVAKQPGEVIVDAGWGAKEQWVPFLEQRLGGSRARVRTCPSDTQTQADIGGKFKRLLESDQLRFYTGTACGGDRDGVKALLLELGMIKGKVTGGRLHLEKPRDPLLGHCDRAMAALYAMKAGVVGRVAVAQQPIGGQANYSPQVYERDLDHTGIGF